MRSNICWAVKKEHIHKMTVVEMRTIRSISGNTWKDRIQNEEIPLKDRGSLY